MKDGIHPNYKTTKVHCACGMSYMTRSTRENVRLDICSNCHPFFTGKQKLMDLEGRVDKFRKKYNKTA
jgi:large subunit ribosomal protein L31